MNTTSTETGTQPESAIDPVEHAAAFLAILGGGVKELRAPKCPERRGSTFKKTLSGYFDDYQRLARAAIECDRNQQPAGVYVTLNPVQPALLARANNRAIFNAEHTTSDDEVTALRWLPIDCDPKRPAGTSATDAEWAAAAALADVIADALAAVGWPEPLRMPCSGNGAWLLYRIDLPNDGAARELVEHAIKAIAKRFSNDAVDVDTTTFNPSRIGKVAVTHARKGDATTDRPHRMATFIMPTGELEIVSRELLESMAATAPRPTARTAPSRQSSNGRHNALELCRKYIAKIPGGVDGNKGSNPTLQAACETQRFGLDRADAMEAMREYNQRCDPPWSDEELAHKLDSAEKKSAGEFGSRMRDRRGTGKRVNGRPHPAAEIAEQGERPERVTIIVTHAEHEVVAQAVAALAADPGVFQRGGILVRVRRDDAPDDGIERCAGSPTIQNIPSANLRERLSARARFEILKGDRTALTHTPAWMVDMVMVRGEYPGIQHLVGISDSPVLRPDGSIHQTPGYDQRTGVIFEPVGAFPTIPDDITLDDADAAATALLDVVKDFRFEGEEHKAAWLAAALTPLARFAFSGPSPLALVDANVRGAGKGLITQAAGYIALGRPMPVSCYSHDPVEMRKRITSMAIAGDRMVLLDNLDGPFGNSALDAALTATTWKDRTLGRSEEGTYPLLISWWATGNNVQTGADLARRCIHIRLDVLEERPEERRDFEHPDLLGWIAKERGRLLTAALTILAAFIRAGRPSQKLTPFGSFEGWSGLVREAVVWAGLPDPCATRAGLAATADTAADALAQLMSAWEFYLGGATTTAGDLLAGLYGPERSHDSTAEAMRAAIDLAVGAPAGKTPTPRQLGNRLSSFRRRVVGGRYLDGSRQKAGFVWRLLNKSSGTQNEDTPRKTIGEQ